MRRESHVRFGGAGRRNPSFERREGAPVRPYTYIPVEGGFLYPVAIMD